MTIDITVLFYKIANAVILSTIGLGLVFVGAGMTPFLWDGISVLLVGLVFFLGALFHYIPEILNLIREGSR